MLSGTWDKINKVWKINYKNVKKLNLENRIVDS